MDSREFVLWLNGFVEMTDAQSITDKQWKMIKEHLALCTNKVTPTTIVNNLGPIKAEPAKQVDIDWKNIFPQPMSPKIPDLVPKVTPWDKYYNDHQPIWLDKYKVIC